MSFGIIGEYVTNSGFNPNSNLSLCAMLLLSLPPLQGTIQEYSPRSARSRNGAMRRKNSSLRAAHSILAFSSAFLQALQTHSSSNEIRGLLLGVRHLLQNTMLRES